MWEWFTNLFFATVPAVVPQFHQVGDVYQMQLAFDRPVSVCVCTAYEEAKPEASCPRVAEHQTYLSIKDAQNNKQDILYMNETVIKDRPVKLVFPVQCVTKAKDELLKMTLLSANGYPTSSGTATVDFK